MPTLKDFVVSSRQMMARCRLQKRSLRAVGDQVSFIKKTMEAQKGNKQKILTLQGHSKPLPKDTPDLFKGHD